MPDAALPALTTPASLVPLTTNQIRGFWAAWGGWALDGMDSFIYALVLTPAVTELLPRSGVAVTPANVAYYGSVLLAAFLVGWGLSMIWGPVADRIGRVRTLMLTIVCYSLFTLLGAFVTSVWQLGLCRLLAGIGIGGEWSMGGTFLAEEFPEERRKSAAGYMHTGYYFGFFLAALANYFIGARYGWRAMFMVGGLPALLVSFIRQGVKEPARWARQREAPQVRRPIVAPFAALFSLRYRRRTILNSLFVLVSIIGLWAGSVYVPTAVIQLAARAGYLPADAARLASYGTMVLSVGTILGCLALPPLAERYGRRAAMAIYFVIMFLSISIGFSYVFYLAQHAVALFFVVLFWLGVGGANFAMYTLWLPEQDGTDCRASAFAFTTSVGRLIGAGITFLVGFGVTYFGTIGTPIGLTSIAFLVGLALLPLGEETRGRLLPP